MAKVTQPLGSSEARGRVSGLVYNTWRGLHTVKSHKDPGHESDPKRQAHKAIVQAAGIRWQSLTYPQRASWEAFAKEHPDLDWSGNAKRLSGYHWYVRVQTRLIDVGELYKDDPPTEPNPTWLSNPYIMFTGGGGPSDLIWDAHGPPAMPDAYLDVWHTKPLSPGRNPTIHDATRLMIATFWMESSMIANETLTVTYWLRSIFENGLTTPWLSYRYDWP
jgi:hypothetical protein